jgi:hypothetical protein
MDFSKRKVRFSLERLETREVPAQLGQVVELPYPAAPAAEVALTAPHDLGQGVEPSIKIDHSDLLDQGAEADALKVQMQDFHFTQTVSKNSPTLTSESDAASALTVQSQDVQYMKIKLTDVLV